MKSSTSKSNVQGEGDYDSAKKYNQSTRDFVDSGKVEKAAKQSAPRNAKEKTEMRQAEAEGRSHAKPAGNEGRDGNLPGQSKPAKRAPAKNPPNKPVTEKFPGR
tara:strand:+ start:24 stop:335 length:312 start_codon:yes stop_codon:yes gene_type:complete